MPFYTYNQNNSGGSFIINDDVTIAVIIEADSANEANNKAEEVGIYFDGCGNDGPDCPCCGDRWYRAYGDEGDEQPSIYGTPIEESTSSRYSRSRWAEEGQPYAHVYYKDGTKRSFIKDAAA